MALLSSGLEKFDYDVPGWVYAYNHNIKKLNDTLLKINALLDVDTTQLQDGALLVWDAGASKWKTKAF